MDQRIVKPGDKVHYVSKFRDDIDNGIIKSICIDNKHAWVVFKCDDDWANYDDYTAERVALKDLRPEWYNQITDKTI